MLTSRIHVRPPSDPEPEDIFQSSLPALFVDDTQNSHGSPGDTLIYQSPQYGDIRIHLPVHPDVDASRRLFAHYLWNAGVLVADLIEHANHCEGGLRQTEISRFRSKLLGRSRRKSHRVRSWLVASLQL